VIARFRYRGNVLDAASRRNDTRSTIVEVAARLLREQGPAAVTTRGVAEAAGVQAPTIYRLFGDKDGLLEAVAEHVMAAQVQAKAAVVQAASADGTDPLDDLRAGWESQIEFGVANPALFRLLSDPDRVQRSPAAQRGRGVLEQRIRRVAETGRLRVSERRAVEMVQAAGTGTVVTLLTMPPEQRDPGLAESMFRAVLQQVLTDAPVSAEPGPLATSVAFRAVAPRLEMLSAAEHQLLAEWLDRAVGTLSQDVPAGTPRD
jgi:AcrR family transcriptional regulator